MSNRYFRLLDGHQKLDGRQKFDDRLRLILQLRDLDPLEIVRFKKLKLALKDRLARRRRGHRLVRG